jgi:hypothetical protein
LQVPSPNVSPSEAAKCQPVQGTTPEEFRRATSAVFVIEFSTLTSLMIIHYFDFFGTGVGALFPTKNDSPLFIDAYTVLPAQLTPERFKSISGGAFQVIQRHRILDIVQSDNRGTFQVSRECT